MRDGVGWVRDGAQYPAMRPLTQAHIEEMGPTPVVLSENNNGVEKSWFYTSTASAGAAYGLIGALVTTAMDAIINAGPSARAQKAANEVAELMPVDALNASLAAQLRLQVAAEGAAGVAYSDVQSMQRLTAEGALEDAVEINTRYTLSEDSSTLRVIAYAVYQNAEVPYATPYTFEGSVPRPEREGPAYRNTFTYYSTQLPVPTLTPELRERLVASVEDSARDEAGVLPTEGSDGYSALQRELENARDDRLTKDEIAIFLTREWLRDDGALLRREIEQAHAFVARYVVLDMNRTAVPSFAGQDELLETSDNRVVRRIGAGVEAGSYVSSSGDVTSFSTYGNTIGIARVHNERIDEIRSASRRATR
ncbi:MAG: hypothetical protein M0D54_16675 [Hyphomonadaceae bacterium JAD_PAG50586_4]|nr:MAG: hypothetical protein M0D54_16675 [Hyphomonadaceae bacterium JAD_PAG50586_4]